MWALIISTTGLLAAQRADGEDTRQLTRKVATRHDVSFDRADLMAGLNNPRIASMAAVDKAEERVNQARGLAALGENDAAAKLLKTAGAKSIRAAVSHSLLTEKGIERLKESPIDELVTTDSVPQRNWEDFKVTVLSVADILAEAICRIHNDQSVSSLFRI